MCMVPRTVELDEDRSRESRPGPGDEEKIWFYGWVAICCNIIKSII